MKICPSCYDANQPTDANCSRCGASLSPAQLTCPSGRHAMDPSWIECVYCKAESPRQAPAAGSGQRGTMLDGALTPKDSIAMGERKTAVEEPRRGETPMEAAAGAAPAQGSRKTALYASDEAAARSPSGATALPRIVGVLLTHSWRPDGQIFPVREGRNLIGRDPERCDIAIPEDSTLSAVNSHITFRQHFVLGDNISMGGTDLNGVPVEEQFLHLPNYARIRTGSTHWIFVVLDPSVVSPSARPGV